jgi:hypothetical protein
MDVEVSGPKPTPTPPPRRYVLSSNKNNDE